jgi:hypothetical protein
VGQNRQPLVPLRRGAPGRRGETPEREEKFDVAFFSTTQFDAFSLGPVWKARFGLPYVIDYQDPWVNEYYDLTGTPPPGGRLKFGFSQWRAKRREPAVLREASGVIAVSDAYGTTLARNYPWFDAGRVKLLPFGAAPQDFTAVQDYRPAEPLVDFNDGCFHHVYAGRCGPDMSTSLSIVFRAFKRFLAARPAEAARVRFHFIGTDYAPRPLRPGMGNARRVRSRASRILCHRALLPGALLRRPLLPHPRRRPPRRGLQRSHLQRLQDLSLRPRPAADAAHLQHRQPGDRHRQGDRLRPALRVRSPADVDRIAREVADNWFINGRMHEYEPTDPAAFLPYTAEGMTRQLAETFNAAAGRPPPP